MLEVLIQFLVGPFSPTTTTIAHHSEVASLDILIRDLTACMGSHRAQKSAEPSSALMASIHYPPTIKNKWGVIWMWLCNLSGIQ